MGKLATLDLASGTSESLSAKAGLAEKKLQWEKRELTVKLTGDEVVLTVGDGDGDGRGGDGDARITWDPYTCKGAAEPTGDPTEVKICSAKASVQLDLRSDGALLVTAKHAFKDKDEGDSIGVDREWHLVWKWGGLALTVLRTSLSSGVPSARDKATDSYEETRPIALSDGKLVHARK